MYNYKIMNNDELKKLITSVVDQIVADRESLGIMKPKGSKKGTISRDLDLSYAKKLSELAEFKSSQIGLKCVFTVVDNVGDVMLIHRMPGSLRVSIEVSQNKAFTAEELRMSTGELAKVSQPGQELYTIQNCYGGKITLIPGGFPLFDKDGKVVGAIGVSGGTADQDCEIANYVLSNL